MDNELSMAGLCAQVDHLRQTINDMDKEWRRLHKAQCVMNVNWRIAYDEFQLHERGDPLHHKLANRLAEVQLLAGLAFRKRTQAEDKLRHLRRRLHCAEWVLAKLMRGEFKGNEFVEALENLQSRRKSHEIDEEKVQKDIDARFKLTREMNETARIESQWDPEVRKRQFKVPPTREEGDPDPEPWEPSCEAEEPSPEPDAPPPRSKEPPPQPKESPPQSKQSDRPSGGPEPRAKARPKWVWPPKPKKAAAGVLTKAAITKWQSDIELFLSDVARKPFPEPPFEVCNNISCQVQDRVLDVCDCVIKKLFAGANLKLARNSLHPDRLSPSPAATRKEVQDKCRELFLVVNSMYEQSIGKA